MAHEPLLPMPCAEFKLSITRALADQLADALDQLEAAPLTREGIDQLQSRPGIYELYLHRQRIYVGKASASLPVRLGKHLRKLSGRSNISLADVGFVCLYVDEDLEAAAPERMLIKKYKGRGGAPWNTNGFGNNDPGRQRDHSLVEVNHFDARYPINLDLQIEHGLSGTYTVDTYLTSIKARLPFNLRFERSVQSRIDYRQLVVVPSDPLTPRSMIHLALEALPDGWQATALPGYMILYRESASYRSAVMVWRKHNGIVHEAAGARELDEREKVAEELPE